MQKQQKLAIGLVLLISAGLAVAIWFSRPQVVADQHQHGHAGEHQHEGKAHADAGHDSGHDEHDDGHENEGEHAAEHEGEAEHGTAQRLRFSDAQLQQHRVTLAKAGPALVWEQYVALDDKRRVREYSLDKQSGKLVATTTIDWLSNNNVDFTFTTLTAPAQVGFGRTDLIVAYQRPAGNFNMLRCQLVNAMPKPCTAPSDTGLAMVTGAALDPSGNLAVLGNGAGVKGFAGMANTAVTINGAATAPAVLVAVDLNSDSAVDLPLDRKSVV